MKALTVIVLGGLHLSRPDVVPAGARLAPVFVWTQLIDRIGAQTATRGVGPDRKIDSGKIVCACFNVSEAAVKTLVRSGGTSDVDGIGRGLKAGTNCGSYIPELRQLLTVAGRD